MHRLLKWIKAQIELLVVMFAYHAGIEHPSESEEFPLGQSSVDDIPSTHLTIELDDGSVMGFRSVGFDEPTPFPEFRVIPDGGFYIKEKGRWKYMGQVSVLNLTIPPELAKY